MKTDLIYLRYRGKERVSVGKPYGYSLSNQLGQTIGSYYNTFDEAISANPRAIALESALRAKKEGKNGGTR